MSVQVEQKFWVGRVYLAPSARSVLGISTDGDARSLYVVSSAVKKLRSCLEYNRAIHDGADESIQPPDQPRC